MEAISDIDFAEVARLVEVTSDAVALCDARGSILHVNNQFLALSCAGREQVVGRDIRDLVFGERFDRAPDGALPFELDGGPATRMFKLVDGSFIPVRVRALALGSVASETSTAGGGTGSGRRILVAVKSLEDRFASDRRQQRLLRELKAANKRLSGTLSIIMATVGAGDLSALLSTVLDRTAETLDAFGSTIYFTESGGFKLRGVSRGLSGCRVPDFVPYGAGVATHVLRAGKACRLMVVPAGGGEDGARADADAGPDGAGSALELRDLDSGRASRLRQKDAPPFKTLVAVPVYFGTQMLGVLEVGWSRPRTPREYDVRVLEVICDYLSIQIVGMAGSIRSARTADLERSLNRIRDIIYVHRGDPSGQWTEVSAELRRMLKCHVCPVLRNRMTGAYVVDFEGRARVELPVSVDEAFFSTTSPAARTRARTRVDFADMGGSGASFGGSEPERGRLARVDRSMRVGRWLARQGLPCQGVFIDMGPDVVYWGGEEEPEPSPEPASGAIVAREAVRPSRMLLLLRDSAAEPIDDLEFDYLSHMVRDLEVFASGARERRAEQRIAQTLQSGMRSTLGQVPGITAVSLYSSATSQALVGGDFYTLIRMPDDQAVMILGDVSGKGVEAASMSALVKTALSAYAWEGAGPASMARSLNSMLMSFSRPETFASAFIAKIDLRSGRMAYCSAGHPPAMLVHPAPGGGEVELVSVQSGVIGAFEGMSYTDGLIEFAPGDILFMYTDGAIEARGPSGDFFGEERLREVVLEASGGDFDGLCQSVLNRLDAFAASALDDDIALVALRFDGKGPHGR